MDRTDGASTVPPRRLVNSKDPMVAGPSDVKLGTYKAHEYKNVISNDISMANNKGIEGWI